MRSMRTRMRRIAAMSTTVAALCLGTLVSTAASAQADTSSQYLVPDGGIYCYLNGPFGQQVQDAGWKVTFKRLAGGNTLANDAKCVYDVYFEVPYKDSGYGMVWPNYQTNMDWAAACNQQYPGSTLEWTFGVSNPWRCKAPIDKYYPPPAV